MKIIRTIRRIMAIILILSLLIELCSYTDRKVYAGEISDTTEETDQNQKTTTDITQQMGTNVELIPEAAEEQMQEEQTAKEQMMEEALPDNLVIHSNYTLAQNMKVNNLSVDSGVILNLNGYELMVNGTADVEGIVSFNKGSIICASDFTLYRRGCLKMTDANDTLIIRGNLFWEGYSETLQHLSAGTLELGGNLSVTNPNIFLAGTDFKTILSGSGRQDISIPGENVGFGILEVLNTSEEGVYFNQFLIIDKWIEHGNGIHYPDENAVHGYKLTGNTTINGNLELYSGIMDLGGYTLTIDGDLIQRGGVLNVNNGKLIVKGDYRIQTPVENENTDITEYQVSYGRLSMTKATSRVYVYGDFFDESVYDHTDLLTNGDMYLSGNMTVTDRGCEKAFMASGSHDLYLKGKNGQIITFPEFESVEYSRINNLYFNTADVEIIEFVNEPYVQRKVENINNIAENYIGYITAGKQTTFGRNSYAGSVSFIDGAEIYWLDVGQDVKVRGTVTISNQLNVNGDFVSGENETGENIVNINASYGGLIINGNLDAGSKACFLESGKVKVAGDVLGNFRHSGTMTLNGTSRQNINARDAVFNILTLENTSEEGVHSDYNLNYTTLNRNDVRLTIGSGNGLFGWKLTEDETIDGEFVLYGDTLDLNGHTLTINGDFIHQNGTVDFNNGTLIINGSYALKNYGDNGYGLGNLVMNDNEDKMSVSGDFYTKCDYDTLRSNLSKGSITIGGDVSCDAYFCSDTANRIILNGSRKQKVSIRMDVINWELLNTSEEGICFQSVKIKNNLVTNGCKSTGTIEINENHLELLNTHEGDIEANISGEIAGKIGTGNTITLRGSYTVSDDLFVNGNVNFWKSDFNNKNVHVTGNCRINSNSGIIDKLTVEGDLYLTSNGWNRINTCEVGGNFTNDVSYLFVEDSLTVKGSVENSRNINIVGSFLVEGNINTSGKKSGTFTLKSEQANMHVGGNFNAYRMDGEAGTLELKGNFSSYYLSLTKDSRMLLSGNALQTISVMYQGDISTLELLNESEEGIYSEKMLGIENIITNGNKIRFGDYEGEVGWTLMVDEVIDGSLTILVGKLDLNGHALTVNGDLLVLGGVVDINGGTLEVMGNFSIGKSDAYSDIVPACLVMQNEKDYVVVHGDFLTNSNSDKIGILSAGAMEIAGNLTIAGCFRPCESHVIKLCGQKQQNVYMNGNASSCYINNLIVDNEILINGKIYINGCMDDCGREIPGILQAGEQTTFKNQEYHGNLYFAKGFQLDEKVTVYGDVTVYGNFNVSDAGSMDIYGNATFSNNSVISGKVTGHGEKTYFSTIQLNEGNILAYGNFFCSTINQESSGIIEIKGDMNYVSNYAVTDTRFILSGEGKQIVTANNRTIGTLELENYSEEGVYSEKTLQVLNLIRNGCRLTYGDTSGVMGWMLEEDTVYDGDLTLVGDELNLNGHTLTVNGNFIHANGTLNLSGGKLIISGDYRLQEKYGTGSSNYTYSHGVLIMNHAEDEMRVGGNAYFQPNSAELLKLEAGKFIISGNLDISGSTVFSTKDNLKLYLSGSMEQKLTASLTPVISKLIIENTSAEGVCINSDIKVTKALSDTGVKAGGNKNVFISSPDILEDGIFGGNIVITNDSTLNYDLTVIGTLTIYKKLALNGFCLHAGRLMVGSANSNDGKAELNVGDGTVNVDGSMNINYYGSLRMQEESGLVKVNEDFVFSSLTSHKGFLTAGILKIGGNFKQNATANFIATGNHTTVLDGRRLPSGKKAVQTVQFTHPGMTGFHNLVLTRKLDEGYQFNCDVSKICSNLIYELTETELPDNVSGLRMEEVDTTTVKIAFDHETQKPVSGYEIYRDGVLAAITTTKEYADKNLMPGQTYTYTVYAFDADKNLSAESPILKTATEKDMSAPDAVNDLGVMSKGGSSVTLCWSEPDDNSGIAYYKVYRDNNLIAGNVKETSFRNTALLENTEYCYEVVAVDIAGNESNRSNLVAAVAESPEIMAITSSKGDIISGSTSINVILKNQGDYSKDRVTLEYLDSNGKWKTIATLDSRSIFNKGGVISAAYTWNSRVITGERDVIIRATVTDCDSCRNTRSQSFYVDNQAPLGVNNPVIESIDGIIKIGFDISESAECAGYKIYKYSANGAKNLIATIDDGTKNSYVDANVTTGETYSYTITAFDDAGNESETCGKLSIKAAVDETAPVVYSITPETEKIGTRQVICVKAEDNKQITGMAICYIDENGEYKLIERKNNKSNEIYFQWDTSLMPEGEIKLTARAFDAEGNVSNDAVS
ncbi:MAG: hypothetical protein PUF12_08640, partial [Thermoflexaceae bacterium]|nr:hypothetical protein [Thermoflexaceae bacterium]